MFARVCVHVCVSFKDVNFQLSGYWFFSLKNRHYFMVKTQIQVLKTYSESVQVCDPSLQAGNI